MQTPLLCSHVTARQSFNLSPVPLIAKVVIACSLVRLLLATLSPGCLPYHPLGQECYEWIIGVPDEHLSLGRRKTSLSLLK